MEKEIFEQLYPRTFIRETSYGVGILERGKQESTHIRRLSLDESAILDDVERLLLSPLKE